MPLTLLVTAMNEIETLPALLKWAGDLDARKILIDSGSTDGTDELAGTSGWEVFHHEYVNASSQLNWALELVKPESWVLIIDADETPLFDPEKVSALIAQATAKGREAISIRRRNYFGDQWLRHGGFYPDRQVRLFKSHLRYEQRPVHAHVEIDGRKILHADVDLRHLTYVDIDDYWKKLLRFTHREAQTTFTTSSRPRWRRLRAIYARMPAKAPARFFQRYLIRLGFLDGRLGWHLALWSAVYEDVVTARRHVKNRSRG